MINENNDVLQLIRYDILSEQKLSNHVDSLVYQVLKYDSTAVNPAIAFFQKEDPNAIIRISGNKNPKPILVINGVPQKNYGLLKQFRLVEMISISYLTMDKAAELCGSQALNGVILIEVSPKRFKAISRRYD